MFYSLRAQIFKLSFEQQKATIANIPKNTKALNLEYNYIGDMGYSSPMSIEQLVSLVATIPGHVTKLYFGENFLGKLLGDELMGLLAAINQTYIDLGNNGFDSMSGADLAKAFSKIRASKLILTQLNWDRSVNELVVALAGISSTVKEITFSYSDISSLSIDDCITLGTALPHVLQVHFLDDDLKHEVDNEKTKAFRDNVGKYPFLTKAHQELNVLNNGITTAPIFPTAVVYEIIDQFLNEEEHKPVLNSLKQTGTISFWNQNPPDTNEQNVTRMQP